MRVIRNVTPPTGLRRALWRLPIWLYRIGLGPLLGHRMMLLTHTGRVSGKLRHAVIEVIHHDDRGYVAASGFGLRADWYRNVMVHSRVTIRIGGQAFQASTLPVDSHEGGEIMARYATRHSRTARRLCRLMGFAVDGTSEDFRDVGRRIPFVRFVPGRIGT